MFPVEAFRPALERIVNLLRESGFRFHLTGGIVSVVYAEPRFTQDADIVVDPAMLARNLEPFIAALTKRDYLFDADSIRDAVANQRPFQVLDRQDTQIDLYPRELVAGELDRSVSAELFPGMHVPIVARTDIAIAKLIWISKGSHKSRSDLRQILLRSTQMEQCTIRDQATKLSLLDLLDEVVSEQDQMLE